MDKTLRVGLYAWVSTHDQQTLPMQLSAMREYAQRRGWEVTNEVSEVGSGAKERWEREELLKAARRREIDAVVVWRLDRWGQSLVDLVTTLGELGELGVGFVSLTEALDLTTPTGRAMAGLPAVFAEFERDLLRERVKADIAEAREQGKPHEPATIRVDEGIGAFANAAFLLIAVGRMTRERADAELVELGLALRHVSALGHLAREPGLSYSELARRAGVTAQSMQATLHQLEQGDAIERRTPPGRGRRAQLHVTSSGRELLAQAWAVMEGVDRRLADLLGESSHVTLAALLEQIVLSSRPTR